MSIVAPSPATIFEAIVKQVAVSATYNRGEIVMAPYAVYTRAEEVYVDGVVMERDGAPPKEQKIGTFKLAGLSALRVTPRRFTPDPAHRPGEKRYAHTVLMTVDYPA
jgi:hypothetical protein